MEKQYTYKIIKKLRDYESKRLDRTFIDLGIYNGTYDDAVAYSRSPEIVGKLEGMGLTPGVYLKRFGKGRLTTKVNRDKVKGEVEREVSALRSARKTEKRKGQSLYLITDGRYAKIGLCGDGQGCLRRVQKNFPGTLEMEKLWDVQGHGLNCERILRQVVDYGSDWFEPDSINELVLEIDTLLPKIVLELQKRGFLAGERICKADRMEIAGKVMAGELVT